MKNILIFTDLNGTLLKGANFDENDMFGVLEQIDRLQKIYQAKAKIHLVSPLPIDEVQDKLDAFDDIITKYNSKHSKRLNYIDGAMGVLTQTVDITHRKFSNKILPVKLNIRANNRNIIGSMKYTYVNQFLDAYGSETRTCIYMGNEDMDLLPMKSVKAHGGFTICPANSSQNAIKTVDYTSDQEAAKGVACALKLLIRDIEEPDQKFKNSKDMDR